MHSTCETAESRRWIRSLFWDIQEYRLRCHYRSRQLLPWIPLPTWTEGVGKAGDNSIRSELCHDSGSGHRMNLLLNAISYALWPGGSKLI